MKSYSQYICQQCGYKSPSFLGRCPNCSEWNTIVETIEKETGAVWRKTKEKKSIQNLVISRLDHIPTSKAKRMSTGIGEVDQVLGGEFNQLGIVPGSMVLLAGDPGIGKSTLALQIVSNIGGLYVSGEESLEQVALRAKRLRIPMNKILSLSETNVESIIELVLQKRNEINILVVDSIQTLWSEQLTGAPGSIGQVRECTLKLMNLAKRNKLSVIIIGHVTKEGTIAGPKILEHIVDTVLYLEGDRFQTLRLLRTNKNRFGPIDEIGVFSMEESGLKEVENPSEIFIGDTYSGDKKLSTGANSKSAGRVIIATLEGTRPLLVEVQALTVASQMPLPRRVGSGINNIRLQMLIAIIQKHLKLPLGKFDIFINVASGIKVFEPAADLGICLAIVSSFKNRALPVKTVAIGEVGLLGEIRSVIGLERRIKEAKKLGFKDIISPKSFSHIATASQIIFS